MPMLTMMGCKLLLRRLLKSSVNHACNKHHVKCALLWAPERGPYERRDIFTLVILAHLTSCQTHVSERTTTHAAAIRHCARKVWATLFHIHDVVATTTKEKLLLLFASVHTRSWSCCGINCINQDNFLFELMRIVEINLLGFRSVGLLHEFGDLTFGCRF